MFGAPGVSTGINANTWATMLPMDVTTAVNTRKSARAFTSDPVSDETIEQLLKSASRAPSGGNVQPWRIFVVNGDAMTRFKDVVANGQIEPAAYEIYPSGLTEPYRTSRFNIGMQLYASVGIARDDKEGRGRQMMKNFDFFGAPATIFCFLDRQMGPPQWADLGMFLQTFMLLATEAGLDTCPQEAWVNWEKTITDFVGAGPELRLFCGVALGTIDKDDPVNTVQSAREPLDVFATFVD